jgi:hypothetical protein
VFGVTDANATTTSIKPSGASDAWSRTSYMDSSGVVVVEANSGPGSVPHDCDIRRPWGGQRCRCHRLRDHSLRICHKPEAIARWRATLQNTGGEVSLSFSS